MLDTWITLWEVPVAKQVTHHQIAIVGGGTAGITVAARLKRANRHHDVAVIEPSEEHYYQPLWTLVGAGVVRKEVTKRSERDYIPAGVHWLRDWVEEIDPERHRLITRSGQRLSYDALVVAPGLQLDWHKVDGLKEALGQGNVTSIYDYKLASYTWEVLRAFEGGSAVFTNPAGQVKCGGAPQKIMYLAEAHFRRRGIRDKSRVIGAFAGTKMLGVPEVNATLERIVQQRGIDMRFRHNLVAIRPQTKEAVFDHLDTGEEVVLPYDMLHVTPPMSAPDFIKRSPLALSDGPDAGWVEVDKHTLQHPRYPNVFALGDVAALPTAKTGAAVRKQAPVLVRNLLDQLAGRAPSSRYDGYSSCPLVTDYGKLVLAEFKYDNVFTPTFPVDQTKERRDMYLLKRYLLPALYWHGMLRGRA
jgi:sulfide:quinone oxidoreductase